MLATAFEHAQAFLHRSWAALTAVVSAWMSSGLFRMMRLRAAIARALAAAMHVTGQPAAAEFIADKAVEIALGFAQADHRRVDTPMMIATRIEKAIVSLRVRERWWKFIGKSGLREGRALCSVHAVLQGGHGGAPGLPAVTVGLCAPGRDLHSHGASLGKSLKH